MIPFSRRLSEKAKSVKMRAGQTLRINERCDCRSLEAKRHLRMAYGFLAINHRPLVQAETAKARLAHCGCFEETNGPFQVFVTSYRECHEFPAVAGAFPRIRRSGQVFDSLGLYGHIGTGRPSRQLPWSKRIVLKEKIINRVLVLAGFPLQI